MSDPVPTTCMRYAVGCGHITQGVDTGYGLGTVRGGAAHPVSRGRPVEAGDRSAEPPIAGVDPR